MPLPDLDGGAASRESCAFSFTDHTAGSTGPDSGRPLQTRPERLFCSLSFFLVCVSFFFLILRIFSRLLFCFLPRWAWKKIRWWEGTRDVAAGYRLKQHLPAGCARVYTWPGAAAVAHPHHHWSLILTVPKTLGALQSKPMNVIFFFLLLKLLKFCGNVFFFLRGGGKKRWRLKCIITPGGPFDWQSRSNYRLRTPQTLALHHVLLL